jgi:hypothetical protein
MVRLLPEKAADAIPHTLFFISESAGSNNLLAWSGRQKQKSPIIKIIGLLNVLFLNILFNYFNNWL